MIARIHAAIDPINVAGLGNPERRNWYPVEADDILNAAAKLDSSRDEVQALLKRCGFVCEPTSGSRGYGLDFGVNAIGCAETMPFPSSMTRN